ncbi:MAG TPA: hypothetical protein VFT82_03190, partial [Candidatus Paceibacterota bacterium]|nr:hypothetical protein [Candidatus Paceibacterota bacterium]
SIGDQNPNTDEKSGENSSNHESEKAKEATSEHKDKGEQDQGDRNHGDEGWSDASSSIDMNESDIQDASSSDAVSSEGEVKTDNDLKSFVGNVMKENDSIKHVSVASTTANVEYARPAKILGLIPATAFETASVSIDSEGRPVITVDRPWWSFLDWSGTATSSIEQSVSEVLASTTQASSTRSLSPAAWANVISKLNEITKTLSGL